MGWSYEIGRIFGIRVKVHGVFLVLLGAIAFFDLIGGSLAKALAEVLFVCMIFSFVLLHELGHSLVAKAHGVRVHDITLLPIGGVARLEEIPEEPNTELKIAIAGPLVNVAIALLLLPLFLLLAAGSVYFSLSLKPAGIVAQLFFVNLMLAGFNVVPAFPLDGGRILRALLAKKWHYVTATEIACKVGRVAAVGFIAISLIAMVRPIPIGSPVLLAVIAVFIWSAGTRELEAVKMRHFMRQNPSGPFSGPFS